jgi:hypothetical protein
MSGTFFNDAFDQYEAQMSEYRANVNNLKDTLMLAKENKLEAAKQLGLELAAPYLAHASFDGIRSLLSNKFGEIPARSSTLPKAPSDVTSVADADANLTKSSVENLRTAASNAVETAREQQAAEVPTEATTETTAEVPPEAPTEAPSAQIEEEPQSELLDALAERNTTAFGPQTEADDFVSGLDQIASVPGAASQEEQLGRLMDFFKPRDPTGTTGGSAVSRPTLDTEFNDEMLNDPRTILQGGGIRPPPAQPAIEPEITPFVEPEASQASTNVFGRLFGSMKQAGQDALDDATSRLSGAIQSNIKSVQSATGASEDVAAQAIKSGDVAIQGGTKALPAAAEGAVEGGAVAGEAAEGAIAATEIATEGPIGLIEAGLTVGLGELINKITDRARRSIPAAIPLPQLAIPTFQPGASFGGY